MPPTHLAQSAKAIRGRYLTSREREDIALELVKGTGIRAIVLALLLFAGLICLRSSDSAVGRRNPDL